MDCCRAIANLIKSTGILLYRVAEATNPDRNHLKSLRQSASAVADDLATVEKNCSGAAAEAAIASSRAALDAANAIINKFEEISQEAIQWAIDHPKATVGTIVVIAGVTYIVANGGAGVIILLVVI